MAKCTIEIEDRSGDEEGANMLSTFEPELPLKQGRLEVEKATTAQKLAVYMLNAAKEAVEETREDFVVGREREGAPMERIENPN